VRLSTLERHVEARGGARDPRVLDDADIKLSA